MIFFFLLVEGVGVQLRMAIKYKCLILDHDDTAVDSTRTIHFPAHLESMKALRPQEPEMTVDDWLLKNFSPGVMTYLRDELGLNERELEEEYKTWRRFNETLTPEFFDGFRELLLEFRGQGGIVTVVSHSEADIIERHYRSNGLPEPLMPDLIFGWDIDPNKRKPRPYPVEQILKTFKLAPSEALIVDDLRPGVLMGQATGVEVAAAGWSHQIPEIREFMERHCVAYLESIGALSQLVFG